jgi:hypothetical protein
MATFVEHCSECVAKLGESFGHVHNWLDEFAGQAIATHRARRHHKEGVEEVRAKWGNRAALAAEIHIARDFGFVPTRKQAEKWLLAGPDGVPEGGASFLTDDGFEGR